MAADTPRATPAPAALPPVLSVTDIAKTFGGARALTGVSFDVAPGEVHGLLGKNGSGKSTLVKILAGFHAPDPGGRMAFNGEDVAMPLRPGDFRRLGMSFVHQNLSLVPTLTVLENLRFAELATTRTPFIDWRRERALAVEALDRFGLKLDPGERVDRLSAVDKALLAIVRAFEEIRLATAETGRPGLVLLDEPTPFLPQEGVARLFDLIRGIVKTGSSVIFISHDIDEVRDITDRATVLRDGAVAGQVVTRNASHGDFVELIVGERLARLEGSRHAARRDFRPRAVVKGVTGKGLDATDIAVGEGEILGLTGLIGSGYEELPYLIFGARKAAGGTVTLGRSTATPLPDMTPAQALDLGMALLPGDRNGASGIGSLPVFENMFLPDMERFFSGGFMRFGQLRREARTLGETYQVRPNDPDLVLSALSGGNAQKVLLARWMNRKPVLLLLDEPTQGVDVGTRAMIFDALRRAAADGMSILCASSDAEQLAEICDRVLVFARGRVQRELTGDQLTRTGIAAATYASVHAEHLAATHLPGAPAPATN
jgi:ribose transport system ATP-binding protein